MQTLRGIHKRQQQFSMHLRLRSDDRAEAKTAQRDHLESTGCHPSLAAEGHQALAVAARSRRTIRMIATIIAMAASILTPKTMSIDAVDPRRCALLL